MTKKTASPKARGRVKSLIQKTRLKTQAYLSKRPHRSFRKTKSPKLKIGGTKLPSVWVQLSETGQLIAKEKWLLIKLGLLYMLVNYCFLGGVSQIDFLGLKETTLQVLGGDVNSIGNATALFFSAVTGSLATPLNELQQFLGWFIAFIFWFAIVWGLRMKLAGNVVKARDALYNSCAPLISSSVLVGIVIMQMVPAAAAIFVLALVQTPGVLQGGVEVMLFSIASILLILLSTYWLSASLLGLIIVTLPGMYPWKALSTASELVIGQRWAIALRLAVMALIICLLWLFVLIPSLLLDGWLRWDWLPLVPIVVQLLGGISLVYGSTYIYKLYRSLL